METEIEKEIEKEFIISEDRIQNEKVKAICG